MVWLVNKAKDEINTSGGISGKPIEITTYDTAMDPTKSTRALGDAIDKGALVTIGPIASMEVKGAMPLAVREGIFCMTMLTGEDVATTFLPWNMWVGGIKEKRADFMDMWAKRNQGMKSVVTFVNPEFSTWVDISKTWTARLEKLGITSLGTVESAAGQLDMGPHVVKALARNPDGFIIILNDDKAAKTMKELVQRGVKDPGKIFVHMTAITPTFFEIGKGYLDGIFTENSTTFKFGPGWQRLVKLYADEHGGKLPSPLTWAYYDAVYMIKACFEREGITGDPAKLKQERIKIKDYMINQKDFPGCKFPFSVVNGMGMIPQYLFRVQNNEAIMVDQIR
jgi:branched-chain amino acid transport system substrate-binding protein